MRASRGSRSPGRNEKQGGCVGYGAQWDWSLVLGLEMLLRRYPLEIEPYELNVVESLTAIST